MSNVCSRRLLDDDAFGVGEALNEVAYGKGLVVRGKHWVLLNPVGERAVEEHRFRAMELFYQPLVVFNHNLKPETALKPVLPANIHLLSLERVETASAPAGLLLLLRLEHLFQAGEHQLYSTPVNIDIRKLNSSL